MRHRGNVAESSNFRSRVARAHQVVIPKDKASPGPGEYLISQDKTSTPSDYTSFGSRIKRETEFDVQASRKATIPGPGQYGEGNGGIAMRCVWMSDRLGWVRLCNVMQSSMYRSNVVNLKHDATHAATPLAFRTTRRSQSTRRTFAQPQCHSHRLSIASIRSKKRGGCQGPGIIRRTTTRWLRI